MPNVPRTNPFCLVGAADMVAHTGTSVKCVFVSVRSRTVNICFVFDRAQIEVKDRPPRTRG